MDAEGIIYASAMFETNEAYHDGKLSSLLPTRQGSLIVTTGRLGEKGLSRILGVSALPILMPSRRAAALVMWRAHNGYSGVLHRSVAQTLAMSRNSAWIVRGKNLAKKICFDCMVCKIERKKLSSQRMALYKEESLQVCRPWTNISLDFAGPVIIKGDVNSRSRKKSWILVIVCRNTKAVCLLATSGYSTCDFLCKWEEFVARKGNPKSVVSDRGSQLVRAGMVLAEKETLVQSASVQFLRKVNRRISSSQSLQISCFLVQRMIMLHLRNLYQMCINPGGIIGTSRFFPRLYLSENRRQSIGI